MNREYIIENLINQLKIREKYDKMEIPVGAVIVKHGKIVGMGRHVKCGLDHAEVAAIKNCKESAEGATMYVTLEPCPMCAGAILAARVGRVVYAAKDPAAMVGARAYRIPSHIKGVVIFTAAQLCRTLNARLKHARNQHHAKERHTGAYSLF